MSRREAQTITVTLSVPAGSRLNEPGPLARFVMDAITSWGGHADDAPYVISAKVNNEQQQSSPHYELQTRFNFYEEAP